MRAVKEISKVMDELLIRKKPMEKLRNEKFTPIINIIGNEGKVSFEVMGSIFWVTNAIEYVVTDEIKERIKEEIHESR